MLAYFLVDIREIKDAARMDEYRFRVASTVEKFGGRYLVRGGAFEVVEGTYQPQEFDKEVRGHPFAPDSTGSAPSVG